MDTKKINITDLENIRTRVQKENEKLGTVIKEKVLVCMGGGCLASGSQKIKERFEKSIESAGLDKSVKVVGTGCMGPCSSGPVVLMMKDKSFYQSVSVTDVDEIVEQHIKNHKIVDRLLYREDAESKPIPVLTDISFFKRQTKIVLRNCGIIDPLSIDDYIGQNGYFGLVKVLNGYTKESLIKEIEISGLRGRGGAGFLTWKKWHLAMINKSDKKY